MYYCETLDLRKDAFIPAKCINCKMPKNVVDCKKYIQKQKMVKRRRTSDSIK